MAQIQYTRTEQAILAALETMAHRLHRLEIVTAVSVDGRGISATTDSMTGPQLADDLRKIRAALLEHINGNPSGVLS